MAKVTGPLHSLSASGTVGGTLTMLRQRGQNIAKRASKPGGKPSAAQLTQRALYRASAASWSALDQNAKNAWREKAAAAQITPFNAYMSATLHAGAPIAGTLWDGGSTTWDAGASSWD